MLSGVGGKLPGSKSPDKISLINGPMTPQALKGFAVRFATFDFIISHRFDLLSDCQKKFNERCKNADFLSIFAKTMRDRQAKNVLIFFSFSGDNTYYMQLTGSKDGSTVFTAALVL
jgi:hypothetical protein